MIHRMLKFTHLSCVKSSFHTEPERMTQCATQPLWTLAILFILRADLVWVEEVAGITLLTETILMEPAIFILSVSFGSGGEFPGFSSGFFRFRFIKSFLLLSKLFFVLFLKAFSKLVQGINPCTIRTFKYYVLLI